MRTLFWLIVCLGVFLWVVTSGREEAWVARGKALYSYVEQWFSEAEADFQWHTPDAPPPSPPKKKRWE